MKRALGAMLAATALGLSAVTTHSTSPPLEAITTLDVPRYMGLWYQTALYPNRFQSQCVSDTTATYRLLPDNTVEVINRCRIANGSFEEAVGLARPGGLLAGSSLVPAKLMVTFLPAWLRWIGSVWAAYWVVQIASDYRYVVVSEPQRDYLWVLSRTPQLTPDDNASVRAWLQAHGFDLSRLQAHGPSVAHADPSR